MSYKIDHAAVRHLAEDTFGIIGPVFVQRVKKRRVGERGWYNMRERDHGQGATFWRERYGAEYIEHRIRLDSDLSPYLAGVTLAHELKHLEQSERVIVTTDQDETCDAVREYLTPKRQDYWTRQCEVEARQTGKALGGAVARFCFRPR